MRPWRIAFAILAAGATSLAWAQAPRDVESLAREVEALRSGQAAILKELQEIKGMLQRGAPPPGAGRPGPEVLDQRVAIEGAPSRGSPEARVVLVEFTDYQCPFCARHFRQTWPQIERDYVATGRVRLVVRDLPLDNHPNAPKAAEAALCAHDQGKFWEMHATLFANVTKLSRPELSGHARSAGLDVPAFDRCVDAGRWTAKVRKDFEEANQAGARGTPTFFVGLLEPDGKAIRATSLIRGAHPYATFKEAFDGLLAGPR